MTHPNPAFRWPDDDAMRAFVRDHAFGALFVATPDGPRVAHIPVTLRAPDRIEFHIARANAVFAHLPGATALFVAQGPHAYVSPDWYGTGAGEVPTWNYQSVEAEGIVTPLDRAGLIAQIDALAHAHEAPLTPKPEWTPTRIDTARADAMLGAIGGFAMQVTAWRGTTKLSQNKPEAARLAAAAALAARGATELTDAMRAAT